MEATLDISKNGDYCIWLNHEEVLALQNGAEIQGQLSFKKDQIKELRTISVCFKTNKEVRALKEIIRLEKKFFNKGPYVMEIQENKVHRVIYIQEYFENLFEKLTSEDINESYQENRYDSIMMRKIFLYCDDKK